MWRMWRAKPSRTSKEQLVDLFDKIKGKGKADNPLDQILIYAAASVNSSDPEYHAPFKDPGMAEIRILVARAFQTSGDSAEGASAAIMALRKSMAAEMAGDRSGAISACRTLLQHINRAEVPETWANTHLKLATTLAVSSQGKTDALSEIVKSLLESLQVFTEKHHPDRCCMAHYNLAIAFSSPNWDEWDNRGAGGDRTENTLTHGRKALAMMDRGIRGGDRARLSDLMTKLLILRNEAARKIEPIVEAISITERMIKSPDFKQLDRGRRGSFEEMLKKLRGVQVHLQRGASR